MRVPRIPELAIFAILQSIMFVLLFAFVFGGAIPLPGYADSNAYREYLMPGIFAQTIAFAAVTTAIGMCDDINKGIIDRFRSLPMARSAVLTGRTSADVVYNGGILLVLMATGLRGRLGGPHRRSPNSSPASCCCCCSRSSMSWVGVWLGLSVPTVEVAQQVAFIVHLPDHVRVERVRAARRACPTWLQPFAEWNPISTLTASLRTLWGNPNPFKGESLASTEPVLVTLIWFAILLAIFAPVGVRRYRNMSR